MLIFNALLKLLGVLLVAMVVIFYCSPILVLNPHINISWQTNPGK